jgi:hypothetical protein
MSILTPQEAVSKVRLVGTIEGIISRFIDGKDGKRWGFELLETMRTQAGGSYERPWTVWTDKTTVNPGDHIIVNGDISFKYEEFESRDLEGTPTGVMKASVKGSINNPHIKPAFKQPETESLPF